MQDILKELYQTLEHCPRRTAEYLAINHKIEGEKHYFTQKMSLDDYQRFEALERLYTQSSYLEQIDAFSHGFKLATMLMCAVFVDKS